MKIKVHLGDFVKIINPSSIYYGEFGIVYKVNASIRFIENGNSREVENFNYCTLDVKNKQFYINVDKSHIKILKSSRDKSNSWQNEEI